MVVSLQGCRFAIGLRLTKTRFYLGIGLSLFRIVRLVRRSKNMLLYWEIRERGERDGREDQSIVHMKLNKYVLQDSQFDCTRLKSEDCENEDYALVMSFSENAACARLKQGYVE